MYVASSEPCARRDDPGDRDRVGIQPCRNFAGFLQVALAHRTVDQLFWPAYNAATPPQTSLNEPDGDLFSKAFPTNSVRKGPIQSPSQRVMRLWLFLPLLLPLLGILVHILVGGLVLYEPLASCDECEM